jgi:hypothetical protein
LNPDKLAFASKITIYSDFEKDLQFSFTVTILVYLKKFRSVEQVE